MSPADVLIRAVDSSAGYNGNPVVHDINLEVRSGELVALLGANGAGKTTTLNALSGVNPVLSGEIEFEGLSTKAAPHRRAAAGMAYVTEKRSVFMSLSVRDNLRVGRCDAEEAVALFPELSPLLDRIGGQLSGGEQQILALARALARHPKLLLADELSLGLAPMIVTRLLTGVRQVVNERGIGALIVEQHVAQALRYADRVYVMRHGRIIASGTPDEVSEGLTEAYLAGDPVAPGRPDEAAQSPAAAPPDGGLASQRSGRSDMHRAPAEDQ